MTSSIIKVCISFLSAFLLFGGSLHAQSEAQQLQVAMRNIGHRVLLSTGDSTSLVLPVVQDGNRFRISFEKHFVFNPMELANAIDEVLRGAALSENYIVEVAQCSTSEVVYSYQITSEQGTALIPCATRIPSLDCYLLYITLHDMPPADQAFTAAMPTAWAVALLLIAFGGIGGILVYRSRRRAVFTAETHTVRIGKYTVDKRNMELRCGEATQTLTGKETELLLLLQSEVNTTVPREAILHTVWGDEGDYVGRTLDVFVSKLRKKLEADPGVRIANIRGIGYKLVVNEEAA